MYSSNLASEAPEQRQTEASPGARNRGGSLDLRYPNKVLIACKIFLLLVQLLPGRVKEEVGRAHRERS